jgi:hypothetical protein
LLVAAVVVVLVIHNGLPADIARLKELILKQVAVAVQVVVMVVVQVVEAEEVVVQLVTLVLPGQQEIIMVMGPTLRVKPLEVVAVLYSQVQVEHLELHREVPLLV